MPDLSQSSYQKLATCDDKLVDLFCEVAKYFSFTVIEGHRGKEAQNHAFATGKSKLKCPEGKHNKAPSKAVDAIPNPIDWNDRERMSMFAGFVLAIAAIKGIKIRWGGDWNSDTQVKDNSFDDLVHFELLDA